MSKETFHNKLQFDELLRERFLVSPFKLSTTRGINLSNKSLSVDVYVNDVTESCYISNIQKNGLYIDIQDSVKLSSAEEILSFIDGHL
jgi:hypothetical protein